VIAARGLAGIVLAAGAARRFGTAKQMAEWRQETLIGRAVRLAQTVSDAGVIVVTGAHADAVGQRLTSSAVLTVFNPAWAEGLSTSLAAGAAALPPEAKACLILLCDQPAVDAADLYRLIESWDGAPEDAAAAAFDNTLGAPAIFPRHHWPGLMAQRGDRGARALLAALPRVTAVPMPHAALDVDTPADLQRLSAD
jgi:molybdenum cofactor cytidylyltransferase